MTSTHRAAPAAVALAAVLTSAVMLASASPSIPTTPTAPAVSGTPADAGTQNSPSAVALSTGTARASFASIQTGLDGPAGVVVFRVGAGPAEKPLIRVGKLTTGVAWSTSKVPVAVAALRRSRSSTTQARARAAITRSDNQAAEKLWQGLGSSTSAARRTQNVVRAAGDTRTLVESRRVRAGFTAFGQTRWRLDDQARFAAGLGCRPEARATVKLMSQVVPDQRFGLGRLPRTAFKGGWGPVARGYLTRQLAIVTLPDGSQVGVAVAVRTSSGFARGKADLTRIAAWLGSQLRRLEGGRCPARA